MNTLFIGRNRINLSEVDSTNNYAAQILRQTDIAEGTLIVADLQTKGRGQRGAAWHSEAKLNLTLSIVLKPKNLGVSQQFLLNKMIALAIRQTVAHFLPQHVVKIKWPNDIFVAEYKVAGLLLENTVQGGQIVSTVAGIGINVNQIEFSPELPRARSMTHFSHSTFDVEMILSYLCESIEAHYLRWISGNERTIVEAFDGMLWGKDFFHQYQYANQTYLLKVICCDTNGVLHLSNTSGALFSFNSGTLQLVQ
jgi:BirA family biotin operon repressor/biotin-[acetyl-CoA-carboxylase] ligase